MSVRVALEPIAAPRQADGLVSVIIPVYNQSQFIARAIDSAREQTGAPIEIIVVDDGSTDHTASVLQGYGSVVRRLHQENSGPSSARNLGLRHACGEFVVFLDADDWMLPQKIHDELACFRARPGLGLVCGGTELVDEARGSSTTVEPWLQSAKFDLEGSLLCHAFYLPAIMFRRDVLLSAGGFRPELHQAEDVDLILRVMLAGCRAGWLKKITVCHRLHSASLTRRTRQRVESVTQVFNDFFAREDLPQRIAAMRSSVNYHVLMWSAWQLYLDGDTTSVPAYLRRTLSFLEGNRSRVLHRWLATVQQLGRSESSGGGGRALAEFLPLCQSALGSPEFTKGGFSESK